MSVQWLLIAEGLPLHLFFPRAREKVFCSVCVYLREFGFRICGLWHKDELSAYKRADLIPELLPKGVAPDCTREEREGREKSGHPFGSLDQHSGNVKLHCHPSVVWFLKRSISCIMNALSFLPVSSIQKIVWLRSERTGKADLTAPQPRA